MTARAFWANRPVSPSLFDTRPFRREVANEVIEHLPEGGTVVELGCGAGANLQAIAKARKDARLIGIDVNEAAVSQGIDRFGLDLRVGDVESLEEADVLLTVSALCHLDEADLDRALTLGLEVAPVLVMLEPWTGQEERVERDSQGRKATPYSWSWDLPTRLRALGARVRFRRLPIGEERLQPYYRLYTARR